MTTEGTEVTEKQIYIHLHKQNFTVLNIKLKIYKIIHR